MIPICLPLCITRSPTFTDHLQRTTHYPAFVHFVPLHPITQDGIEFSPGMVWAPLWLRANLSDNAKSLTLVWHSHFSQAHQVTGFHESPPSSSRGSCSVFHRSTAPPSARPCQGYTATRHRAMTSTDPMDLLGVHI